MEVLFTPIQLSELETQRQVGIQIINSVVILVLLFSFI